MKVYSIYSSVNGEVNNIPQGMPITILRLVGCNLQCTYCDSPSACDIKNSKEMSINEIVKKIILFGNLNLLITGGEPALQRTELSLLIKNLDIYTDNIILETNGTCSVNDLPMTETIVMDYKLPSSFMENKMKISNFRGLSTGDFVKFVIQERIDFDRALEVKKEMEKYENGVTFLFSPIHSILSPRQLFKWMQQEGLHDCILNLQIHKYIWPEGEKEIDKEIII